MPARLWRGIPLAAPFLVGAAPIVALWAANRLEFPPSVLLPLLLAVTLLAGLALVVGRALTGRWVSGALVASVIVGAVVGYGLVLDLVGTAAGPARAEGLASVIVVAMVAAAVIAIALIAATARAGRFDGADASRGAAVAAMVFMLVAISSPPDPDAHAGGGGEGGAVLHNADSEETPAAAVAVDGRRAHEALPDVYYVILDGYTRADVLDEVYDFDNEPFLDALEARGFYVARDSYANYPATYLSLASSLNERYMTSELVAGRTQGDYRDLIQRGAVPAAFKQLGYRYVLVKSVWEGTARSPLADEVLGQGAAFGSEFAAGVVERSIVGGLLPPQSVADSHLAAFDALGDSPDGPGPTFTFAHIIVPHPPYVLDRDGTVVSRSAALRGSWAGADNQRGYLEQLRFANRRFVEVLDKILARSEVPPIVIVQGDHGVFGATFESEEARRAAAARLAILNAYLVPDEIRDALYPSISPVNSFRLVLSSLTGQAPALLDDRFFYYEAERPGPFIEVEPDFRP